MLTQFVTVVKSIISEVFNCVTILNKPKISQC